MTGSSQLNARKDVINQHLDALMQATEHEEVGQRAAAIAAIGNLDWQDVIERLILALSDPAPEVRLLALEATVNAQLTQALPAIETCFLEDDSDIVRGRAALCIALLSYKPKYKLLLKGTQDKNPSIQLTSWVALYLSGANDALDSVTPFLSHPDAKLRLASVELLSVFCSQQDKEHVLQLLSERFQLETALEVSNALQKGLMDLGG